MNFFNVLPVKTLKKFIIEFSTFLHPATVSFFLPPSRATPLHLQPGVVHRRWHGSGHSGRADVTNDAEGLPQGVVHPQHLVAVLRLLLRLLHQRVLVTARVQLCQQLSVDELLRLDTERVKAAGTLNISWNVWFVYLFFFRKEEAFVILLFLGAPPLVTHIVNHEMHDGLWHQVAHSLVDDGHVGVNQVANSLHLPLQLRVHAVHEAVRAIFITTITLWRQI